MFNCRKEPKQFFFNYPKKSQNHLIIEENFFCLDPIPLVFLREANAQILREYRHTYTPNDIICMLFLDVFLFLSDFIAGVSSRCTHTHTHTHCMSLVDVQNNEYCPDFRCFHSNTNLHYKIIARKWILCYCVYFDWHRVRGLMYALSHMNIKI